MEVRSNRPDYGHSIDKFEEHVPRVEKDRLHMRLLKTYLDISDGPDHELATQEEVKVPGSCQWLEERRDSQKPL